MLSIWRTCLGYGTTHVGVGGEEEWHVCYLAPRGKFVIMTHHRTTGLRAGRYKRRTATHNRLRSTTPHRTVRTRRTHDAHVHIEKVKLFTNKLCVARRGAHSTTKV